MSTVIGYARVSTIDQDLEGQRLRLTEAGASRIFEDKISGKTFERPGLDALLDYVRKGDTVAVVRLDRLGRSLPQLIKTVSELGSRGVILRSLEESIDTGSAAGELVFHVFASLAQFEQRLISERTREGQAAARARGSRFGRPIASPEAIAAALTLVDAGYSPTDAGRRTGVGRSTIYREITARERAAGMAEGGGDQQPKPRRRFKRLPPEAAE